MGKAIVEWRSHIRGGTAGGSLLASCTANHTQQREPTQACRVSTRQVPTTGGDSWYETGIASQVVFRAVRGCKSHPHSACTTIGPKRTKERRRMLGAPHLPPPDPREMTLLVKQSDATTPQPDTAGKPVIQRVQSRYPASVADLTPWSRILSMCPELSAELQSGSSPCYLQCPPPMVGGSFASSQAAWWRFEETASNFCEQERERCSAWDQPSS